MPIDDARVALECSAISGQGVTGMRFAALRETTPCIVKCGCLPQLAGLAAARTEPPQQAGVDHVVAHLGGGLVVILAGRRLQVGSRRAGEASCAAPGFRLTAGERDEKGVGECGSTGLAAPADP